MQTMAGLGRAALSALGAGRGRAVIGLFSQSPVQSSPVVAVERQAVPSVTSTGWLKNSNRCIFGYMLELQGCDGTMLSATPQESLELPASEPKNTAMKMEVER